MGFMQQGFVMKNEIKQHIGSVALVVNDYDEAIAFYTEKLQFTLIEDTDLGEGKRWVLVSPPGSNGTPATCKSQ